MFKNLLSLLGTGGSIDILTIIDTTLENETLIGKMLIIQANGQVDSGIDTDLCALITAKVKAAKWEKQTTISVVDSQGRKYRLFWDRIINRPRAIVFGGGHVSQTLVQVLSLLDFEVSVIDDRPEFANKARFPGAYRVICESFQKALKEVTVDPDTAVIIVTRGHRYDMDCLRAIMHTSPRYLGMIGSKRRIREILTIMREEGAPADLETRLRAPIGLDINAETPAEIAVSIAAEVIGAYRGGSGQPLSRCKGVS
ncbi:MAG: XdhC family protein [Bacillota bacterium]|nr:XdhC family protein [Negativicutes bacterium]